MSYFQRYQQIKKENKKQIVEPAYLRQSNCTQGKQRGYYQLRESSGERLQLVGGRSHSPQDRC